MLNQAQRTSSTLRRATKGKRGCFKVTEKDLRDMARYKYERRDMWDQASSIKAR